jgi:hypothetical protein
MLPRPKTADYLPRVVKRKRVKKGKVVVTAITIPHGVGGKSEGVISDLQKIYMNPLLDTDPDLDRCPDRRKTLIRMSAKHLKRQMTPCLKTSMGEIFLLRKF